jgi:hypothetical protein
MKIPAFTSDQQARLRELRAQRAPIWVQIAELQCSPQTLQREAKRAGIPGMKDPIDKRRFAKRWEEGASIEELMAEFGRKESTVRSVPSKLQLSRPKAHPWAQIAALKAELAAAREEIARLRAGATGPNGAARPAPRREDRDGVPRRT